MRPPTHAQKLIGHGSMVGREHGAEARGHDGLLAELRQSANASRRNIPVAALTAYARSDDRMRCIKSGFQIHLSKPIDPGELVATVAALAGRVDTTPT